MPRFLAVKHLGSLRAADDAGEEALRKIGQGELVMIEMKRSRNIQHHRLFWALATMVHHNLDGDRYPTVEDFVAALKIAAGLRIRIELPNGDVGFIPGSIAFHKMDQTEFSAFYDRVCDLIAKYFLPGVTSAELKREVQTMIGVKPDALTYAMAKAAYGLKKPSRPMPGSKASGIRKRMNGTVERRST